MKRYSIKFSAFLFLFIISIDGMGQIIADHKIVADFEKIPDHYINEVKKMWLVYAGESHSYAIRAGLAELGRLYPKYAVKVRESGTPDLYTTSNLRVSTATWGDYSNSSGWIYSYGEEDWFTNATAVARTKAGISYCNNNNIPVSAMGFGWCWDLQGLSFVEGLGLPDPVYGCRWYGISKMGPQGDRGWGLDDEDYAITGNSINLDTYLKVTQEYIDYCNNNSIPTKVFFTTGPVDAIYKEAGYGAYLKYERIREYVRRNESAILFDYADILCHNNDGSVLTTSWNGHNYPRITNENLGAGDIGHIGMDGALRLAKAMWWMLARMAGWNGSSTSQIPVSAITISGGTSITTRGGTLQLSATVQPANATNKTVSWSITSGSSFAGINAATGLLTAVADGVVTVRATATDGSGVYGSHSVTIANQKVLVKAITIIISKGSPLITVDDGSITLSASISPSNASNKSIAWSVINETGMATIDQAGRLVAIANGTVRVKATALDGSNVSGTLTITITNQINRVQTITIHSVNGNFQITDENRTLQLEAVLLPEYATNQEIIWSINNLSGHASIDNTGLVTGISSGIVSVKALAADGSGVFDEFEINIQFKPTESLKIIVDENELKVPLDEACPDCRISLYSLSGYLLNSKPVESDLMIFERAGLRPGMFFIILDNQHGIIRTGKVIIGK